MDHPVFVTNAVGFHYGAYRPIRSSPIESMSVFNDLIVGLADLIDCSFRVIEVSEHNVHVVELESFQELVGTFFQMLSVQSPFAIDYRIIRTKVY